MVTVLIKVSCIGVKGDGKPASRLISDKTNDIMFFTRYRAADR